MAAVMDFDCYVVRPGREDEDLLTLSVPSTGLRWHHLKTRIASACRGSYEFLLLSRSCAVPVEDDTTDWQAFVVDDIPEEGWD